jgi:hypothetical protein
MTKFIIPALAIALLAGCAGTAPTASVPTGQVATTQTDSIDMFARLAVTGQDGYRLMATQTAYNLADIDHVTLTLYRSSGDGTGPWGSAIATKKVNRDGTTSLLATAPVTLQNLKMDTHYKVVATAYAAADETVAANRIDTGLEADGAVSFKTPAKVAGETTNSANADTIDTDARTVTVKVKLKDKTFNGRAESANGVTVTNGTIVDNGSNESF